MFHRLILIAVWLGISQQLWAGYSDAQRTWESSSGAASWRRIVIELAEAGHYFSAVPFMKEYLVQSRAQLDEDLDEAFEKIIVQTGVRPFETLPESVLGQSRSPTVRYILAKKHFRKKRWQEALNEIAFLKGSDQAYPFASHLRAAIYALEGKQQEAEASYRDCVSRSSVSYNSESNPVKLRQILLNRDSCLAGIARLAYGRGDYLKADSLYLDIPKSSHIWPEILMEEAWTSYYLKNYNRTLGKLVSYKAPVFDFIFNPEIEVLKALAYLKLCLFKDVNLIVEEFYSKWLEPSQELRSFIMTHQRDHSYFFKLITEFEQQRTAKDFLMQAILLSISKDPAWQEMKLAYINSITEFNRLKGMGNSRFNVVLLKNIREVVQDYQNLLGNFGYTQFRNKYNALSEAFQGMSFIKLEVLALKKKSLYEDKSIGGKRGDVKYIDRNEKQYFWDFNGEFWADELGDYVFALGSEC